jgi:phthalate 4,5-cis-dihydrodiol dehydrogenase
MMETLQLGFAGLGMAAGRLIPEISQLPYIKLTAAADLRPQAREKFKRDFNTAAFESVEELCQSPNVDAIYVATPHEFHAAHTIAALKNRKHVIVEKPMAV